MSPLLHAALAHGSTLGLGLALGWQGIQTTTHLTVPTPTMQLVTVLITTLVTAGVGAALAAQPQHDEGNRATVDGVLAALVTIGLLALVGLVLVGRSNPLFFGSTVVAGHHAAFAATYSRLQGPNWLLIAGPVVSGALHLSLIHI